MTNGKHLYVSNVCIARVSVSVLGIRKFLRPSHKQLFGSLIGDEDGLEGLLLLYIF